MPDASSPQDDERRGPLGELLWVGPRLMRRTRSQAEFLAGVLAALPCPLAAGDVDRDDSAERDDQLGSDGLIERTNVLSVFAGDLQQAAGTLDAPTEDRSGVAGTASAPTDEGPAPTDEGPAPTDEGPAPIEADLAVPDYDSLAASQVVPRLATLSPDELIAIGRYEQLHRGRQTILSRVAQLLAS